MKLTELDPNWFVTETGRHGMGITFDCPCKPGCGIKLGVWFANPVDGGAPAPEGVLPAPRWKRTGETFETLTLEPSVDASQSGHWHGYIRNGEIC